jgi:F-type H+-transporting ATPase subunit gamma
MAQIREIKQRLKNAKNINQITKAMKMVATARLKRAQQRILGIRPYAYRMAEVMRNLAKRMSEDAHPLLAQREKGKTALLIVTADRGLCGSFNANIIRRAQAYLRENPETVLLAVGKKGRDFFKRRNVPLRREWLQIFPQVPFESVIEMRDEIEALFVKDEFKSIVVLYNEFKSVVQQKLTIETLLPIHIPEAQPGGKAAPVGGGYDFEPDEDSILESLLSKYLATEIHRILLESFSSEMGARRNAMEAATKNATEMIAKLTLEFNRARQAIITKEIAEIVGGAEALK